MVKRAILGNSIQICEIGFSIFNHLPLATSQDVDWSAFAPVLTFVQQDRYDAPGRRIAGQFLPSPQVVALLRWGGDVVDELSGACLGARRKRFGQFSDGI
jgi:hypothetical protein